jgi:hypothetical protein
VTEKTKTGRLAAALIAAQRDLKAVHKGSENAFHRYRYASAEDMMSACRQALHAQGLAARSTRWSIESDETHRWVVASYELIHESGEVEQYPMATKWPFQEEKGRPLDKALAGALTSSLGYWLRSLLLVPRDDEEMDKRDDRAHDPEVLGISRAGKLRASAKAAGITLDEIRKILTSDGTQLAEDPAQWPAVLAGRIATLLKTSGTAA